MIVVKEKNSQKKLSHSDVIDTFLAFYIVLHPQGIRKHMKALRKRYRVHIA